jgi:hypothetical protein
MFNATRLSQTAASPVSSYDIFDATQHGISDKRNRLFEDPHRLSEIVRQIRAEADPKA